MRALLDTNIIIYRENNRNISNYSIGHLFRWLDKLKYEKVIHQSTIDELDKFQDKQLRQAMRIKLDAYEVLKSNRSPDENFLRMLKKVGGNVNDQIDNCLLYELYLGHVDIFITEDRRLRKKADYVGLSDKVFSINSFITKVSQENPSLIEYKELAVKQKYFCEVDITDPFFDSFRNAYAGFDKWFAKKCDEKVYVCETEEKRILGFLYLKVEQKTENYSDIRPQFSPCIRLKIGTFKVESTGFRLGERFIQIIFDNAINYNVDEIYVTMFDNRQELVALEDLLKRWGFEEFGLKITEGMKEKVLIKKMHSFNAKLSPKENYPNIIYNVKKYILPIDAKYHTDLLPDSRLRTEKELDLIANTAHRYALQKVYISFANANNVNPGDLILFYRSGEKEGRKKYESVITTIGIVEDKWVKPKSKNELFKLCQNRSVFSDNELNNIWEKKSNQITVIRFIYVKSMNKRPTLQYLWDNKIIEWGRGPRPFTEITDQQFDCILTKGETKLKFVDKELGVTP